MQNRLISKALLSNVRRLSRRNMSTKKSSPPKTDVSQSRVNPKVADQAAKSKSERVANTSSGSGAGIGVLAIGIVAGAGGFMYKLNTDAAFNSTLRKYKLGSVVDTFGKIIPLAQEKEKETTSTVETEQKASSIPVKELIATPTLATKAKDESNESAAQDGPNDITTTEKEGDEEIKSDGSNSSEETSSTSSSDKQQMTEIEARQESQEDAIAAAVASEESQKRANKSVQTTVDNNTQAAADVADSKPKVSEMDRLRTEVVDIERSVAARQSEVKRDTVAQLRVREAQLRGELENMLARDLSELNIEDLRRRVVQLVMELQERNKTEAAQLIAVLENAETKATEKSVKALRDQSETYKNLVRVSLREQEIKFQDDYAQRLDKYIADSTLRVEQVADELKASHKVDVEAKIKLARAEHEAEVAAVSSEVKAAASAQANSVQTSRVAKVEDLRLKLQALDKVFQVNAEYLSNSHQIHLVSTALLALTNALDDNGGTTSLSEVTASLRVAAQSDQVIVSALDSLPKAAMAGVPTVSELEERFALAREESRKALYTPDGSGVVGHALGSVAAGLTLAPSGDAAEGEGTEACLARAHHYIKAGNVRSALHEVGRMEGDAAGVMVDWVEAARMRLLVKQAVRMISAHVTTLVATLS